MNEPAYACPSLLELEELRLGLDSDLELERHVASCRRCGALLAALGDTPASPPAEISIPRETPPVGARVRAPQPQLRVRTGALWRAAAYAESDFAWVVAVIGRTPDIPDALLVAPVCARPELATGTDLLLDANLLGYSGFLDMANLGSVLREQLLEPVAHLERDAAQAMVELYRHLLGGAPAPVGAAVGADTEDEADPRLLAQAERAEALQELWRPAHLLVTDADEEERSEPAPAVAPRTPEAKPAESVALLSTLLAKQLESAGAEWDRSTLLEESGADGAHLSGFLADRLQLTDKSDVDDLARILHVLSVPWKQAEPAVGGSLARSAGGERRAEGPQLRMAARSRAGADPKQTTKDLYADRSRVDESDPARARQITGYLNELRRALEELE